MENIYTAFGILILSFLVSYWIFRRKKISKKKLQLLELLWLSTLIAGIYFATEKIKEDRIKAESKYAQSKLAYEYDGLVKDLEWIGKECRTLSLMPLVDSEKNELQKLEEKVKSLLEVAVDGKDLFLKEKDHSILEGLIEGKNEWAPKNNTLVISSYYNFDLDKAFNAIDNTFTEVVNLDSELEWEEWQYFLYFSYPALLSLVLGIRLAKALFVYNNFETIK